MKSRTGLFVILGLVALLFFWGCGAYNGLIGVDQEVKAKWGDVKPIIKGEMIYTVV